MRHSMLATLVCFLPLTVSSALAQTTGISTGGGGTAPGGGVAAGPPGDWSGFTWVVALVAVLVVAAIWFFARRRGRV
jgi:hypothetical protein